MAEANAELWLSGAKVACTRQDIYDGTPVVLDDLRVNWGRQSMWDQPDEGTVAFRLFDKRTDPQPLNDVVHVGQEFTVIAEDPNTATPPLAYIANSFEGGTPGDNMVDGKDYDLEALPQSVVIRTNLATDPNCTSTTGKTAGGSAAIGTASSWSQDVGGVSVTCTPNGSNNASSVFPQGGSGMTVFTAGNTYTVSCYYRLGAVQTGTLSADARKILIQGGTGAPVTFAQSAQAPNTAGTVTRLSVTFTIPANYTSCRVQIVNGSANAAQVMFYDWLLIEQHGSEVAGLGPYFDGNAQTGYNNAWTGTTNASTSTQRYAATSGSAHAEWVSGGSPGDAAWLRSGLTRAQYFFGPADFNTNWVLDQRPIKPGESWTYSVKVKTSFAGARFDIIGQLRPSGNPDEGSTRTMTIDGASRRRITSASSNWETYTGTFSLEPDEPTGGFPVFGIRTLPDTEPLVDELTVIAPGSATTRETIISGRVTNVSVSQIDGAGAIEIECTGTGSVIELANAAAGAAPWPVELYRDRILRVIDLIPVESRITASADFSPYSGIDVAPRDIDAQPILELLREYAAGRGGIAWPLYPNGIYGTVWLEYVNARDPDLVQPSERVPIDACKVYRSQVGFQQSPDNLITVVEIGYKVEDPAEPGTYLDATYVTDGTPAGTSPEVMLYGYRALRVSSEIIDPPIDIALDILNRAKANDWAITGVTVQSDHLAQDDLMRLLSGVQRVRCLVELGNLPEYVPSSLAAAWLEGGVITYTSGRWVLELYLTAANVTP